MVSAGGFQPPVTAMKGRGGEFVKWLPCHRFEPTGSNPHRWESQFSVVAGPRNQFAPVYQLVTTSRPNRRAIVFPYPAGVRKTLVHQCPHSSASVLNCPTACRLDNPTELPTSH